jgi:heme a synthase
MKKRTIYTIVSVAVILAFVVVVLGAYARLTDSGLGCPDWPGCYGHLVLPNSTAGLEVAQQSFPEQLVEPGKAWKEMIHRYAAGTLGLLIFVLFIQGMIKRYRKESYPMGIASFLFLFLFFQAALGMWTVTWKLLPLVVMGHLLGGLTLLSLLRYMQLTLDPELNLSMASIPKIGKKSRKSCIALIFGLILVSIQIALGGWVSSNYAGLACVGFPYCNSQWLPVMNFHDAFNVFSSIGIDYQGGKLDSIARVTIQMVHRINAVVTALYVMVLAGLTLFKAVDDKPIKRCAWIAIVLVLIQFGLGIILVVDLMPLDIAVAHNAVAALLLLTMVSWLFYSRRN